MNTRDGKFAESACADLANVSRAHRGAANADLDADGKVDVVVTALQERVEAWKNTSPDAGHWLHLKLRGTKSNRDAIGARVKIGNQTQELSASRGYASSSLTGLHFGLAELTTVPRIDVRWPSGKEQTLTDVKADQDIHDHGAVIAASSSSFPSSAFDRC